MNIANENFKTQCLFYADFLRFLKDKNIFKKFMFNYLNGWRYRNEKKSVFNFITQFYKFNSNKPFYTFFGSIIMNAFCWRETKEGSYFWDDVYAQCQDLIYEGVYEEHQKLKHGR